jgi:propane monooxygenase large subunit
MTDDDFEWFEHKYPGWYDKYGEWWENYRRLSDPRGYGPIKFAEVDYQIPLRCWTCMVPCLIREDMVVDRIDGHWRTYCSAACHWTDTVAFRPEYRGRATPSMGRLVGEREWDARYHHWDLADIQQDLGIVRDDGRTLIPQPHLGLDDPKKLWTLDDCRGYVFVSPNRVLSELTDEQRERFVSDYKAGGPAGRFGVRADRSP